MLQRTIKKQDSRGNRRIPRSLGIWLAGLGALLIGYYLLPTPKPALRSLNADDGKLLEIARSLTIDESSLKVSEPGALARAKLGKKLFFDRNLSKDGSLSCASCHKPEFHFTDRRALAQGQILLSRNTHTLLNVALNTWFHWDGKADSLALQALKPIEDPREQAISRTNVVRQIIAHHLIDYEAAFGKLPVILLETSLPAEAMPKTMPANLSLDVAAHALSTLGSYPLITEILANAQTSRRAPAMELSQRALALPLTDPQWHAAWESLPEALREAINQVFVNVGLAIAEFEKSLISLNSPFDQFVAKSLSAPKQENMPIDQLFNEKFGRKEWNGFKFFATTGRCILCHNGPNFSDQQFHNIGLAQSNSKLLDIGRAGGMKQILNDPLNCRQELLAKEPSIASLESCKELPFLDTENLEMVGAFKTPSLRNITQTGPYMHDGRFETLDEVLEHYNELNAKPAMGHREETLQPLELSKEEREALKAFLHALGSPASYLPAGTTASGTPALP